MTKLVLAQKLFSKVSLLVESAEVEAMISYVLIFGCIPN